VIVFRAAGAGYAHRIRSRAVMQPSIPDALKPLNAPRLENTQKARWQAMLGGGAGLAGPVRRLRPSREVASEKHENGARKIERKTHVHEQ
jgi:hypothetical protein